MTTGWWHIDIGPRRRQPISGTNSIEINLILKKLVTHQFDKIKVLKIPDVNLTKSFKCPMYMGSTIWNALPREIQDSETYKKFKYLYKQYLG